MTEDIKKEILEEIKNNNIYEIIAMLNYHNINVIEEYDDNMRVVGFSFYGGYIGIDSDMNITEHNLLDEREDNKDV